MNAIESIRYRADLAAIAELIEAGDAAAGEREAAADAAAGQPLHHFEASDREFNDPEALALVVERASRQL